MILPIDYIMITILTLCITVEQDISADTLFSRLGDFAVSWILIFADAGTVAKPNLGHFLYQTQMCADPTLFMVHIIHHSLPLSFI